MTRFIEIVKRHVGPPVDVSEIIRDLGIELDLNADLDDEISGELERKRDGKFKIAANVSHSDSRKRFTIAHELGHYMLHAHLIGDGVDDNRAYRSTANGNYHNLSIKPRHETEANRFAAQLLMPKLIVERHATAGKSVEQLSGTFKVSTQAMEIRLNSLGINVNGGVVV